MAKKEHKPVLVTIPEDWLAEFKKSARADGTSLIRWLAEAGRKKLSAEARKRLGAARGIGRPPKSI